MANYGGYPPPNYPPSDYPPPPGYPPQGPPSPYPQNGQQPMYGYQPQQPGYPVAPGYNQQQPPQHQTIIVHQPAAEQVKVKERRSGGKNKTDTGTACCAGLCAGMACCCFLDACEDCGDCEGFDD